MRADDRSRARGHRGDFIDVQRRGVAGEDRARLTNSSSSPKTDFFSAMPSKTASIDHIRRTEIVIAEGRLNQFKPLFHELLGKAAPVSPKSHNSSRCWPVRGRSRPGPFLSAAPGCRRSRTPSRCHRPWSPHQPRDAEFHWDSGSVLRNVGNLRHFALAKENMNQSLGLIREQTVEKQLLFQPRSLPRKEGLVEASIASIAASGAIRLRCFLRRLRVAAAKIGAFCSAVPSF